MEGLTRLVSESLARHGFDRPLDYRRLHWSRWFRCESPHSLLFVPSKPGVFAVAEEIIDLDRVHVAGNAHVASDGPAASNGHVETAASAVPRSAAVGAISEAGSRKPEAASPRRMLAVTQFFEDDDMAFVLDRMLSRQNPMRARLISGRYFVRFVVIEDQAQRRSICNALNQWMVTEAEKATGIGGHFATSLELTPATEHVDIGRAVEGDVSRNVECALLPDIADTPDVPVETAPVKTDDMEKAPLEDAPVETAASAVPPAQSAAASPMTPTAPTSIPTAPQFAHGAVENLHPPTHFPSGF